MHRGPVTDGHHVVLITAEVVDHATVLTVRLDTAVTAVIEGGVSATRSCWTRRSE